MEQFGRSLGTQSLRSISYVLSLCFTVLLKWLWRLYGYGSTFKCRQCLITAPVMLAVLTPDYKALTNQGERSSFHIYRLYSLLQ
jgi:hypothetical protein